MSISTNNLKKNKVSIFLIVIIQRIQNLDADVIKDYKLDKMLRGQENIISL